ncbi:hypothetical protein K438DRAFT_1766780 [Mycena galopus ATCC 62051]|nr:hypothetical protein K438DRAFT_1766780 [Mycena galopus ATCC 62051]
MSEFPVTFGDDEYLSMPRPYRIIFIFYLHLPQRIICASEKPGVTRYLNTWSKWYKKSFRVKASLEPSTLVRTCSKKRASRESSVHRKLRKAGLIDQFSTACAGRQRQTAAADKSECGAFSRRVPARIPKVQRSTTIPSPPGNSPRARRVAAATSHPPGASSGHHPQLHLPHPHLLLSTHSTSSSSNPSSITTPTPNSTHQQEPTLPLIWTGEPIGPGPCPALFHAAFYVQVWCTYHAGFKPIRDPAGLGAIRKDLLWK